MDQQPPQSPSSPPPARISFEEIVVWIEERRKLVLLGIALIGLAGLIYVVTASRKESKGHEATAALFQFQSSFTGSSNEPPAAEYLALLSKTEATGIAQHVKLRAAVRYFTSNQYGEAQQAFEAFIREFPMSPLLPEAALGAAASLEAQGKNAEALSRYQEISTRYPQSSLVGRTRLGQARLLEVQGDQQQAFRIYQDLASQSAGPNQFGQSSPLEVDASIAMRRLVKLNPALLQTNAPSVVPSIAPTNVPSLLTAPAGS